MNVFNAYSEYYDLLYSSKDYAAEAHYVHKLLKRYELGASDILELGCGTGMHACLLAEEGFNVDGVDRSNTMLAKAELRKTNLPPETLSKLSFYQGDIRIFRNPKKYDAVISLFHVMSYMTTDEDLLFAFHTAAKHLRPGGIFIFDCWHGPAVMHDAPVSRAKRFENENISVERISYPQMFTDKNLVDVKFDITVRDKRTGENTRLEEVHAMRYLFTDEIRNFLGQAHLEMTHAEEWLTHMPLSEKTWNACYVCRRKGE